MYSVNPCSETQWSIVDGNQRTVFIGTRRQAEDWLDFQENMARQAARAQKSAQESPSRIAGAVLAMARDFSSGVPTFFQNVRRVTGFLTRFALAPGRGVERQQRDMPTDECISVTVHRTHFTRAGTAGGVPTARQGNLQQKG
jgi:hypothetical protein